jgi:hypothetical protein
MQHVMAVKLRDRRCIGFAHIADSDIARRHARPLILGHAAINVRI